MRSVIALDDLRRLPDLPARTRIDELKEYGMVNLVHTEHAGRVPTMPPGFYRMMAAGRVYVVEVGERRPNGEQQVVWLHRPKIRVRVNGETPDSAMTKRLSH